MMGTLRWSGLLKPIGLIVILLVGLCSIAQGANDQPKFKLLSDEAADACIQDMDCLRDLFLKATLGEAEEVSEQRVFKWTEPSLIANFTGRRLPKDLGSSVDQAHQQMSLLASAAGADVDVAEEGAGGVVNVILLVSDDFVRDRDDSFSEVLSNVFAGRNEIYDELSSGTSPVCQSQLFVDRDGSISGALGMAESDAEAVGLRRCLYQIILKALGLRHPLPSNVDSVLNPKSEREAWTSIDYVLLKLLYDPLTVPGMGLDELTRIFPQLYQEALRPSS